MTYPPPPGVPGDPGQQPMPDPYAPGGGYAPPPSDPYGQPPQGDPYGQPPQGGPYGQPPQGDPYGTPPPDPYGMPPQGDPYGQPPMSGVPMSPGAPGMGQDPYGQPPMGGMPGQPPSFLGGQPPKKSNLGWILGGVGGAAVLIILVVVGIVVFNSSGNDDSANGGNGGEEETSQAGEKSSEGESEGGGSGGTYQVTEGMCEKIDVSTVPSTLGLSKFDDLTLDGEMYCSSMGSSSSLVSLKGKAFGDEKEAEAGYESYKDTETVGGDGLKEFTGDWTKGEISQYSSLEGTASVFIVDGNMAITMYISATDKASNAEAKDAATALAEGIFKAAAA